MKGRKTASLTVSDRGPSGLRDTAHVLTELTVPALNNRWRPVGQGFGGEFSIPFTCTL